MSGWLLPALLSLAAVGALLLPLLSRQGASRSRQEHDVAVYRSQLEELERERERGEIGTEEAEAARREISRRLLHAAEGAPGTGRAATRAGPWHRLGTAASLALFVPFAAAALYASLGAPELADQPLSARPEARAAAGERAELERLTERLAERLQQEPGDARGWQLLGTSYTRLGRREDAAAAFARAATLAPEDAAVQAAYGQALVAAAEGTVTPRAREAFRAAGQAQPSHPAALYYLALAERQAGRSEAAYRQWLELARQSPADAPWLPMLREQLAALAAELERDLAADWPASQAPGAAAPALSSEEMAGAAEMSPAEREAFIQSMVARLAARLEAQPDDPDGWLRLGRAYAVLGQHEKARAAYEKAAGLRPQSAEVLAAYADAVRAGAPPEAPLSADALALYRRALEHDPQHLEALWFAGLGAAQRGRLDEAAGLWERLLAQIPSGTPQYAQLQAQIARLRGAAAQPQGAAGEENPAGDG